MNNDNQNESERWRMDKEEAFLKDLERVINCHSRENCSNTPDFMLARYLLACLIAFETGVQQRETWYGRNAAPGWCPPTPPPDPE